MSAATAPGSRVVEYGRLMRIDRPVGTLLLLWPTLAALWMAADGLPSTTLIVVFTAGTFLMRAAGCVINDYADRDLDGKVERTRDRPLATGRISEVEALVLFGVLATAACVLIYFLNDATRYLALGGMAIAVTYPFMKRFTYLPQVVLGAAFSWGIPMAFTAVTGTVTEASWLYFTASVLWIVAYDTWYAMVDRDDDLRAGIKSTAILFASADRMIIGILQVLTVLALYRLGLSLDYDIAYFLGLLIIAGLFIHQQRLTRKRSKEGCFAAFKNNIWVGFVLFCAVVAETHLGLVMPSLLP
ncbi:MAG: 4-hydroxybenzoate octaprenyltransferase [Pseudomonadaceae bacterium]|nr:4-hydroxybenzoate octaprenyltransferase [Pseudomonadaceae bacterium]